MVNVTRETIVHFDREMDSETIDENSFYLQISQTRIDGTVEVSSTNLFATFFPNAPLPASAQLQVVVDGDQITDLNGDPLDANENGVQPPGSL